MEKIEESNVSEAITINEAKELGNEPGKICKPEIFYSDTPTKKAKGEDATVQCRRLTKAGSRCKHMTSIANGYCYLSENTDPSILCHCALFHYKMKR